MRSRCCLYVCVTPPTNYLVFYAVRVVSKESRPLVLPRTSCAYPLLGIVIRRVYGRGAIAGTRGRFVDLRESVFCRECFCWVGHGQVECVG
jgi:hypothetical protein